MKRIIACAAALFTACLLMTAAVAGEEGGGLSSQLALEETGEGQLLVTARVDTGTGVKVIQATGDPQACQDVVDLINGEREAQGLEPLAVDQELTEAALLRAVETSVKWSHTRPGGTSWMTVCQGVNGENLAKGHQDAQSLMEVLLQSEGHKANLLRASFTRIGVGAVEIDGVTYWVQLFGI